MSLKFIVANRLIKLFGAIVKMLGYFFHFVFPKVRFTIPKQSNPFFKSSSIYKIPKIIWQTNYTNKVSLPVYCNYLFNRLISPDYEYRYMGHEEREKFLKDSAPSEIYKAFKKLTDGAAQADLWRLFVLNFYGGIYMDIDGHTVWTLSGMIRLTDTEVFLLNKKHYTNYFIATVPNNLILTDTINLIVENIKNKSIEGGVYKLTGPSVLNIAIGEKKVNNRFYRTTCIQGSFTNEYFQYIDKPRGKWTHAKNENLLQD